MTLILYMHKNTVYVRNYAMLPYGYWAYKVVT